MQRCYVIVIVDFYKMETITFNTICQLASLFTIKKYILPFVAFFNCHFRELLYQYFSNSVVGTYHVCYRQYSQSATCASTLYFPETRSMDSPSNDQAIRSDMNVNSRHMETAMNLKTKVIYIF
jgi:hypothetical protein